MRQLHESDDLDLSPESDLEVTLEPEQVGGVPLDPN